MAINPMQKKARTSFLLGVLVTLIIAMAIIALLFVQLNKLQEEKKELEASYKTIVTVKSDIKSGESLLDKIETKRVTSDSIPTDALSMSNITDDMIAKVDLAKGTVLSSSVVVLKDEQITADVREQQYNMVLLPEQLIEDDYIDIRLMLPTGQDYIVVSKKCVKRQEEETIWVNLSEDEILTMSNAIVEAYKIPGSKLYATRYVDAGNQAKAAPTYPVSREVLELINNDPNVVEVAKQGLWRRYNEAQQNQRNNVLNSTLQSIDEQTKQSGLETNLNDEITKTKETRKDYIDGM